MRILKKLTLFNEVKKCETYINHAPLCPLFPPLICHILAQESTGTLTEAMFTAVLNREGAV